MVTVFTIGHSIRSQAEVHQILFAHDVDMLVDVRSYPSSRHCPQWNHADIVDGLPGWLTYQSLGVLLGGKRKALPVEQSVNGAWRNASFRGYGDYMQTEAFRDGLIELIGLAETHTVAIMCAEAVWWRCHRSMVSDALVAWGHHVTHLGSGNPSEHTLRDFAVVEASGRGPRLTYPPLERG